MALTPRYVLTWSWAVGVSYTATRLEGTHSNLFVSVPNRVGVFPSGGVWGWNGDLLLGRGSAACMDTILKLGVMG